MRFGNDLMGNLKPKGGRFDLNHGGAAQRLASLIQRLKENPYMFLFLCSWLLPPWPVRQLEKGRMKVSRFPRSFPT